MSKGLLNFKRQDLGFSRVKRSSIQTIITHSQLKETDAYSFMSTLKKTTMS